MRRVPVLLCLLLACAACGSGARPAARPTTTSPTPSVSASPTPSAPAPPTTPAPTPSRSPRATSTKAPVRTATPQRTYVAPPPESETFVAPTLVSTKLGGCDYLGDGHWRVRYAVTLRGGDNWQFHDSTPTAGPFGVTHAGTSYGSGGTVTGTFHLDVYWFADPDGGGVPEEFDQKATLYAIRNEPGYKTIDVKLPARHQLTAHCTR